MLYTIKIKCSLDTVLVGQLHFNHPTNTPRIDNEQLDQLVFDLESSFNSRLGHESNRYRVHIERAEAS